MKKGLGALIVAKMGGKSAEDGGEESEYSGKEACAEDMMRALDEKDTKAFMEALDSYLEHR